MSAAAPFSNCRLRVAPEWIDYNGHMNVGFYGVAFDKATDALLDRVGLGIAYRRAADASIFVVESHMVFEREVAEGEALRFETQVLDADDKRMRLFHEMRREDGNAVAATNELLCLHVDLSRRRAAPFPESARAGIAALAEAHRALERPVRAGRGIALRRKPG